MIYDCFSFFNELDLLEIRLNALDKVVDKFVISESRYTHTGKPKPLFYEDNKDRFSKFQNKIIHVISPDPDDPSRASHDVAYGWTLENRQRNATIRSIERFLHDDDFLIVSDLDEIPNPAAIQKVIKYKHPVRLRQKMYCYYLNYRCCTTPYWNTGSVVLPYKDFCNPATYRSLYEGPAFNNVENVSPTATKVRALSKIKVMHNGGWHFSYIGGIEKVLTKINSIVDGRDAVLTDEAAIRECIASGNDIYGHGEWFFAEMIDDTFPEIVNKFPQFIFHADDKYMRSVRIKRMAAYLKWLVRPLAWELIPHGIAVWLSKRFAKI